jgi:hypothetical protein
LIVHDLQICITEGYLIINTFDVHVYKKGAKTMTKQTTLNDAERIAIEKEIKAILEKIVDTCENLDISYWASVSSNEFDLGGISRGVFYPTTDAHLATFREGFTHLEYQKLEEEKEWRIAVPAPNVAIVVIYSRWSAIYKNGNTFTGDHTYTIVFVNIDDAWKIIHLHQSVKPVEE